MGLVVTDRRTNITAEMLHWLALWLRTLNTLKLINPPYEKNFLAFDSVQEAIFLGGILDCLLQEDTNCLLNYLCKK